ncbi:MAG: PAS domain S-box protein [Balneolaceae bacterium]
MKADHLFLENPNPMWIYDPSDLSIKHVNESACSLYGYSEKEFLTLTIADLRPASEIHKLEKEVSKRINSFSDAGIWIHKKKDGDLLYVRVFSHPVHLDANEYKLVSVQNVTDNIKDRQELQMLLENSLDGIMLTSPDGQIFKANRAACQLLGMSEERIIELGRDGIVFQDSKLQEALERRRQSGTFSGELTFLHSSGQKIPVEMSTSVFTNLQGEHRTSMIFRDVTDKRELERLLDQAYSLARIGVWELNLQNGQLYWSSITTEIHEVDTDFVPDLESGIGFYKEGVSRTIIQDVVERAVNEGIPWDEELQIVTAKGNERWVRSKGEPVFVDGICRSIYGIFQDIHDRKQAQSAVHDALQERQRILESIGDGFFSVNRDWIVTYWNSAAEQMLETPKEDILGKNLWEVFHDATELPSYINYHRVMDRGVSIEFEDYYEPLERWYDISAYPSEEGISVYFKDTTNQKNQEADLRQSLKEKETLLTEIHHRVKNNLAVVSSMLQIQAYDTPDKTLQLTLEDSVRRIKTIGSIHELLYHSNSFSRLEIDQNIRKLISDIAETFRPGIDLEVTFDLQKVSLNINQAIPVSLILNEVVTNIFKHAFDHDSEGMLHVNMTEHERTIKIQITDNGKGLPPDFGISIKTGSLGLKLIEILSEQIAADCRYESSDERTHFILTFEKSDSKGSSSALLESPVSNVSE